MKTQFKRLTASLLALMMCLGMFGINASAEKADDLINFARSFLGYPYVSGGSSPSGFDCCGFTHYVFSNQGAEIGWGLDNQSKAGESVSFNKSAGWPGVCVNMKKGDLIFYDYGSGSIAHVAIYTGDGNIINAEYWSVKEHTMNQSGWGNNGEKMWECITKVRRIKNFSSGSSSKKPTLSNCNMPGTITVGQTYSVHGTVSSGGALTNVTAAVYDVNGNMKTGQSVNPGTTSYDIKNLDYSVYFNKLSPGVYTYKVSATNSSGTTEESKVFIVLANADTVKPGNYKIRPSSAKGNYLDAENHNPDSGANVCLTSTEKSNYQTFSIASAGGGYYTIKNRGSKKYLDVSNASSASGTNVQLWTSNNSNAQLWQILPTGSGYCFVPKCAIENCMDVKGGNLSNGSNIQTYTANLSAAQRFSLIEYKSSIQASCTSLDVGKNRTATFTATYQTKSASSVKFTFSYTKSAIKVSSGKWNNHEIQITVKGKKAGNTTLTIKLVNSKTNKVLATKQIPVTVTSTGLW